MADIRYVDLMPSIPMAPEGLIPDVYADHIGALEMLDQNFRATYVTWGWNDDGRRIRVPVVKIIRPKASLLTPLSGIMQIMARAASADSLSIAPH